MEKFADFILKKRSLLFGLLTVFAGINIYLATFVNVNADMTEYLPADSEVRAGLDIMRQEFEADRVAELHLMFEGLEAADQSAIYEELSELSGISHIVFDENSEAHVLDGFTLYTLILDSELDSSEEHALVQTILDTFSDFSPQVGGNAYGVGSPLNMVLIIVPTVIILILIFFIMCHSWFEPIIYFLSIGIAILINTGTNVIFGTISEGSSMLAGVLQVALSMDYAIIFLNRYRREKEGLAAEGINDHHLAMKKAILNSFNTISGIAFTTIIGMLMLLFMSFTIGTDMGLVIAKSVFISLICVFGVLPALVLRFDTWIEKTKKPALSLKMDGVGQLSYKVKHLIATFFVILFAGAFFVQDNVEVAYSQVSFDPIRQVFDLDHPFVLLYENDDEAGIEAFIELLEENERIVGIYTHALLEQPLSEAEIAHATGLDEVLVGLVFRNYFSSEVPTVTLGGFLQFLQDDVMDLSMASDLLPTDEMSGLADLPSALGPEMMGQTFTSMELAGFLPLDPLMIDQLLYVHDVIHGETLTEAMTPLQFTDYLLADFSQMPLFEPMFTEDVLTLLEEARVELTGASSRFVSPNFSRIIINTTFAVESEETFAFIDEVRASLDELLTGEFHLVSESGMPHELSQTFPREHRFISLLTSFSFFVVAAITFKSISVALLLAIVIQASVFIAMSVGYFLDTDFHFLDVIVVQAILKSRVIDYGILYIANYIEARQIHDVKQAVKAALNHSIDTILTSGMIIVLVTFVSGLAFVEVNFPIAQILFLIAQGCLIGILLSIFVLPALIALCDRFVIKKERPAIQDKKELAVEEEDVALATEATKLEVNVKIVSDQVEDATVSMDQLLEKQKEHHSEYDLTFDIEITTSDHEGVSSEEKAMESQSKS